MALALLLALLNQTATAPTGLGFNDPPTEMIDFLGRRMRCAQAGSDRAHRRRLRCAALVGEERVFRGRFAGNTDALRWLDQAPLAFRLERRFVATFDGPVPARPRRTEQSGIDFDGRPYRLTIDTEADGGRSTRIAATYNGWPERIFTLSNRIFPLLDLQSLEVGRYDLPGDRPFSVKLRYGLPRGYCGEVGDDREQVTIGFGRAQADGYATQRTNCQRIYRNIRELQPQP